MENCSYAWISKYNFLVSAWMVSKAFQELNKINSMYFGKDQGNAGDLSKLGKEKGKTKLIICLIAMIVVSMILASLFLDNN